MGNREQSSGRRKPASRAIGRDAWERILAAAANGETGLRALARAAGVHTSTVKRAMEVGWPERGLPPVSEALALRRAAGRALAEALPEVKFDADGVTPCPESVARAALPSALYQVAQESRMLGSLQAMGGDLAAMMAEVMAGQRAAATTLSGMLAERVAAGTMDIEVAVQCLGRLVAMSKASVDVLHELMKMHRLALGQPGEVIGQRVFATVEEAVAVLDRGTRQAARMRELGLVSSPGGRGTDGPAAA